jgi:cytochrome P450
MEAPQTPAESFFLEAMSPSFQMNPYPLYDRMRVEAPILELAPGQWFVFAHEPVAALLRNPNFSSDERRSSLYEQRKLDNPRWIKRADTPNLLFMDPPDHTRLRRLVARAFTSSTVEQARMFTNELVQLHLDQLADLARGGQPVDLMEHFAHPIPVAVIGMILGVPTSDLPMFKAWSRALSRSVDPGFLRDEATDIAIDSASEEMQAYLDDLANQRRRAPTNDLLSALLAVEDEGDRISRTELLELVQLLLIAGHETTVNLIGNAVVGLFNSPSERARLVANPALFETAIDEFVRYDSPVQLTQRIALLPTEMLSVRIEPGDQVVLLLGSANRDPRVFTNPDQLRLDRDAKRQVGFGGGIHHCLGAPLARMETAMAIESLLKFAPNLALAEAPTYRPSFTLRGPDRLLVMV